MNKMLYVAAAAFAAGSANAQVMVEQVQHTTTVTHEVPANPYSGDGVVVPVDTTYTTVETTAVGSAPTVDPGRAAVVKLTDGTMTQFPDTPEKSWQEYAREQGYDRFTFDPTSGLFVLGKGEAKFEERWDENGNRLPTPVAAPAAKPVVKKVVKKQVVKQEAAVEETAPAEETPAAEPVAKSVSQPAAKTAAEPAASAEGSAKASSEAPATAAEEKPAAADHGTGH